MADFDLVIRGGRIVNAGDTARADVGIVGGAIVQIGGEMRGAREIDATGHIWSSLVVGDYPSFFRSRPQLAHARLGFSF